MECRRWTTRNRAPRTHCELAGLFEPIFLDNLPPALLDITKKKGACDTQLLARESNPALPPSSVMTFAPAKFEPVFDTHTRCTFMVFVSPDPSARVPPEEPGHAGTARRTTDAPQPSSTTAEHNTNRKNHFNFCIITYTIAVLVDRCMTQLSSGLLFTIDKIKLMLDDGTMVATLSVSKSPLALFTTY